MDAFENDSNRLVAANSPNTATHRVVGEQKKLLQAAQSQTELDALIISGHAAILHQRLLDNAKKAEKDFASAHRGVISRSSAHTLDDAGMSSLVQRGTLPASIVIPDSIVSFGD